MTRFKNCSVNQTNVSGSHQGVLKSKGFSFLFHSSLSAARLSRRGDYVNALTHEGESACYLAAQRGHLSVVRLLLKAGSDVNQLTNDSSCPLYAGRTRPTSLVVHARLSRSDVKGKTRFPPAVDSGHQDVVKLLVSRGAQVDRTHTASCWTCLHQAVYKVNRQKH